MLRIITGTLITIVLLALPACKHQQPASTSAKSTMSSDVKGGNGTSFEEAVIIMDSTESAGIATEYVWLRVNYPGYKLIQQSLVVHEGKPYDVMEIKTSSGRKTKVYFDISNFFGKF